jgi:predicted nucleotidyltransferase
MILDKNILKESKQTKTIASKLLDEKNVLEVLSQVGTPLIIGSYALDLMIDPDIDIVVETAFPKQKAKEALDIFIEKETVQKYEFGDFVKFPRTGRPQ